MTDVVFSLVSRLARSMPLKRTTHTRHPQNPFIRQPVRVLLSLPLHLTLAPFSLLSSRQCSAVDAYGKKDTLKTQDTRHTSVKAIEELSRDHQKPRYRSISSCATKSASPCVTPLLRPPKVSCTGGGNAVPASGVAAGEEDASKEVDEKAGGSTDRNMRVVGGGEMRGVRCAGWMPVFYGCGGKGGALLHKNEAAGDFFLEYGGT